MNVQKVNYQKELDKILDRIQKENKVPSLLLHSCCAPCSSYVLEYLSEYFEITVFYYNPNIYPESEYEKRIKEQQELIGKPWNSSPSVIRNFEVMSSAYFLFTCSRTL